MTDTTDIGTRFEVWVAKLLQDLGKLGVKHNVVEDAKPNGENIRRCQLDVVYGSKNKIYGECKYKSNQAIPIDDVQKFVGVLKLLDVPVQRGVMFTNTEYHPAARFLAEQEGLNLYDGKDIERMDYVRLMKPYTRAIDQRRIPRFERPSLEEQLGINT